MRTVLILAFLILCVDCTRGSDNDYFTITVRPGLGTLESIPHGYKVCYALNVTAPDIPSTPRECGTPLGYYQGFVDRTDFALEIPRGVNRTVELYAYLNPDSQAPCPILNATCDASRDCNTYKMAWVSGVISAYPQTNLSLNPEFPGLSHNAPSEDAPFNSLCAR